jgi:hypothetical protein
MMAVFSNESPANDLAAIYWEWYKLPWQRTVATLEADTWTNY